MFGGLAQLARAPALQAGGQRFESVILHYCPCGKDSELNTPHSWLHTRQNDLWHVVTDKTVEKKISIQLKVWASVVYAFPQGEIYIDTGEESKKGRMADA